MIHHRARPAVLALATLLSVAVGADALGQSPDPSASPAPVASGAPVASPGPVASGSPVASPGPVASVEPSLPPDPEVEAADAACAELLTVDSLVAALGQPAVFLGAAPEVHPGMPPTIQCGYRLADGTGISLTSQWAETTGPDRSLASAAWGPRFGGTSVEGLPAPAWSATFDEGRRGLAWTPVLGPALTQVLDVEAWLPDGTAADVPFLALVAGATVTQGTVPLPSDPACARLLPGAESIQSFAPGRNTLVCGYDLGGGRAVLLKTGLHAPDRLAKCCERIDVLGPYGRARQLGPRKDPSWRVDWAITPGRTILSGTLQNALSARQRIGRVGLILLAEKITKAANRPVRTGKRNRR